MQLVVLCHAVELGLRGQVELTYQPWFVNHCMHVCFSFLDPRHSGAQPQAIPLRLAS